MGAYASRVSKYDKRITLHKLALAHRRGRLDSKEYRLRRQLARRAQSVEDLQTLLWDLHDLTPGRDHWRYGRWRGPVREGHELEIQRIVGAVFLIVAVVIAAALIYGGITLVNLWR